MDDMVVSEKPKKNGRRVSSNAGRITGKASKARKKTSRKTTPASRLSKRHKPVGTGELSLWKKNLIAWSIVCLFVLGFYFVFIRPYAYRWRPCYGLKWYGVCMPCCYDVHGIDISHYQGEIDWARLDSTRLTDFPIEFVFIKATEGNDHTDTVFERNFRKAADYGLIRGAYHFFSPKSDPIEQADFFIRTVKLDSGDLPPVLDVEVIGKNSAEQIRKRVKLWLDRVEEHYGVKPILYTSYKFKKKYLNDTIFDAYPYWIAHYYVDSVRYEGKWYFWQHTDVGTVPGIGEDVDLDVFNGSLEQLKAFTLK